MAIKMKVRSPFSGKLIREIPLQNESEVFAILDSSYRLFCNREAWLSKVERVQILQKVMHNLYSRKVELARLAAIEGGKPLQDSLIEVERARQGVGVAIRELNSSKGEMIPMGATPSSQKRLAYTIKEPVGVVVAVSAFNHPLNLIVHQVIPALAVGAPVIVKPSKTTPLSCLNFLEMLYEAGLPKDWCRSIICENEITEKLLRDPRIRFLSFIGSAQVGWYLRSQLPPGAHCALEHGGVAPVFVEKDADIQSLIPALLKGGFYHAGQVCVSVQRVFIHEAIIDEVITKLLAGTKKLVVGDPLDERTDVGPLITPEEVERVAQWVEKAVVNGGELLCGGKKINKHLFAPTIILNPPTDCELATQEVFGPVIVIHTYRSRKAAINLANSLPYSFQAAAYTKNLDVAMEFTDTLKADAVIINDHTAFRVDWMPFGGSEDSGLGRGGIPYSMDDMTKNKLVVIKSDFIR